MVTKKEETVSTEREVIAELEKHRTRPAPTPPTPARSHEEEIIRGVVKDLKKKLGGRVAASVMGDENFSAEPSDFVPTSSTLLNLALAGGIAVGRITEIYGEVQTGKTLLALDVLAQNQQRGGLSYYLDAEFGTGKQFAKDLCKIDDSRLGHLEVKTQEDCWDTVDFIIRSTRDKNRDRVITIGIDSLAALPARAEKEQTFEEEIGISLAARVIRKALRKLTGEISTENVALVFTNHEIYRIGGPIFGEKTISWGGTGPKYFATTRIKLDTIARNRESGEIQSLVCRATVIKNRFNPPGHQIEYFINVRGPHLGIDDHASVVEYLVKKGALGDKKGWITFDGRQMRKGALIEESRSKPEVYDALRTHATTIFKAVTTEPADEEDGVVDGVE